MASKKASKKQKAQAEKAGILTDEVVIASNDSTSFPHGHNATDSVAEESQAPAITPKTDTKIKSRGELDAFGFGSDTHASFLLAHLEEGTYTKAQITEAFCDHFRMGPDGKATSDKIIGQRDDARKKSSMSVFFSDVIKPFGAYHASRSLIIVEDDEKRLSLEPKRAAVVKKAVADGILTSLKGFTAKKHPEKVAAVLKKFGLSQE